MKISVVIIVTYQVRKIKWKRGNESLIRSTLGVTMYMCGKKKKMWEGLRSSQIKAEELIANQPGVHDMLSGTLQKEMKGR